MTIDVPPGWSVAKVSEIVSAPAVYGILQPGPDIPDGVPYVRPTEVQDHAIEVTSLRRTTPEIAAAYRRSSLLPGDVILSIVGTIGKVAVVPAELDGANITQSSVRIRVPEQIALPRYVAYSLRAPQLVAQFNASRLGTAVPRLNIAHVRDLELPLAPREQQPAIVAAIESHLSRLDAATATLERVQRNLERYRASVLKAAVEGRLVPTEAELAKKEGRSYEPASVLLKRILAERRRRWEEAELAKLKAKGKTSTDDRWKAKYEEPAAPDTDGLPELPEGWCWARAEQCVEMQVGHAFKSSDFLAEGVNLLRGDNIGHGRLRWDDGRRKCIRPEALSDHRQLALAEGDIVLAMDRPVISTGLKSATVRASDLPALLVQRVIRLRPNIDRDYFLSILGAPSFIGHLTSQAKGGGVPHVSENQIGDFTFAVPPLVEQRRIVDVADRLLVSSATALGAAEVGVRRSARLRQSILKWAFEGRLVDERAVDATSACIRDLEHQSSETAPR